MPLIEGEPATRHCDARRLSLRERVALIARVCEAVQAAHQALIVHRDLKPSNLLVDAAGRPHVLDFGIAKLLDQSDDVTHTAAQLMTPAYAAPEQIRSEPVSTATDVFALGVILYELACGQHPFLARQASPFAMQRAVLEAEPRRLSAALGERTAEVIERAHLRGTQPARLRRALHGDLNRIVSKALAKDPGERYGSAAALGADLQRWLQDEPVQATPASFGYRARKFLLRHRWSLAASALVATVLLAATVFSLQQARTARLAQREAEANAQSAQATQRFLQQVFLAAEPWNHEGAMPNALQLADRAFETLDRDLADQPRARADLYVSLARLYNTAGAGARAVEASRRAVALLESDVADVDRLFVACLRLADAYGQQGEPHLQLRWIERAAALPGLGSGQRFLVVNHQAQALRDRGRYDLALGRFREAYALGEDLLQSTETPFARQRRAHAAPTPRCSLPPAAAGSGARWVEQPRLATADGDLPHRPAAAGTAPCRGSAIRSRPGGRTCRRVGRRHLAGGPRRAARATAPAARRPGGRTAHRARAAAAARTPGGGDRRVRRRVLARAQLRAAARR
ncbi:MAG: serine/threonine protein kinase [Xanthomonadales bacterium]|nr:serine/threonine protein kinase [Xanthomonadales bacterium]